MDVEFNKNLSRINMIRRARINFYGQVIYDLVTAAEPAEVLQVSERCTRYTIIGQFGKTYDVQEKFDIHIRRCRGKICSIIVAILGGKKIANMVYFRINVTNEMSCL